MIATLAFSVLLAGSLTLGWLAGDRRDRPILVAVAVAVAMTTVSAYLVDFQTWRIVVAVIDLALLCFVLRQAVASARHWPIWFAGFHAVTSFCNFVALFLSAPGQTAVLMLGAFWSLPALASLVVGVLRDWRAALAPGQSERT